MSPRVRIAFIALGSVLLLLVASFIVGASYLRAHYFEPFVVPTGSMIPTIHPGDRLYADKRESTVRAVGKGDVVLFRYPQAPEYSYINRIVGVGGDTVEGTLVPEGHFFMMGDNRDNSYDSRQRGTVPKESVFGKALFIWISVDPENIRVRWDRTFKKIQ